MRTVFRVVATLISAVATLYFVFWVGGALIFRVNASFGIAWLASLVAACLVAWFVWKQTASVHRGLVKAMVLGAFLTGGIAFSVGFFGPIIFTPSANQGPLLGIFITGPLGFVAGALGGAIFWISRRRREARMASSGAA
jgi:hypothetical protein